MKSALCSEQQARSAAARLAEEYDLQGAESRLETHRMMVETYSILGKGFQPTPADVDSCLASLTRGESRPVSREDIERVALKYLAKRC